MKRPILLTIVATLWFFIGVFGVVVDEIRNHGLQLMNFNFINILVGVGLLCYWRIARWYALFIMGCSFFSMLIFAPWATFNSELLVFNFPTIVIDQRPHAMMPSIIVIPILLTYLVVSGWCFWALSRRDVRELF